MSGEAAVLYMLTHGRPGAIIGENAFPDELPQDPPYPCVCYYVAAGPRGYSHDGQDGVTRFIFQVDCYAESVAGARALSEAVRLDLSGYKGTVPTSPPIVIQGAFLDNEADSAESGLERSGAHIKTKSLDFIIWIEER